jgi:programmed cell death 6-interacting protein
MSTPTQRLPSHQANEQLTSKAERYRNILDKAAESDAVIKQRWDEWEKCIARLTWDEVRSSTWRVPSSRFTTTTLGKVGGRCTFFHRCVVKSP